MQHVQEHISISKMINQPTGKSSAFFASRARVKSQLEYIFIKNLRRYRRDFYAVPYIDENTRDIYYYVAVPSEFYAQNRIRWDCVIQIIYDSTKSLDQRDAKFYTNSPSFIYTYAYVFNQEGILPQCVIPRLPTMCITTPPVIKNPVESRGYDKILMQALLYLKYGNCLSDGYINHYKQRWNNITRTQLLVRIADTDKLVALYEHSKRLESLKKKTNRKPLSSSAQKSMRDEQRTYEKFKRATTPTYTGLILKKAPRSKITARKAKKFINKLGPKPKRSSTY